MSKTKIASPNNPQPHSAFKQREQMKFTPSKNPLSEHKARTSMIIEDTNPNSPTNIKYLTDDELLPLEKCDLDYLTGIQSNLTNPDENWETQFSALDQCRRLNKHHKGLLLKIFGHIVLRLPSFISNIKSGLSKNSIVSLILLASNKIYNNLDSR